jgi:putative ABC transport system permease protein
MSLFTDGWERLRALLFRDRMETELDEELQFHLDRATDEGVRRGLSPEAARRAARLALDVEATKEAARDARGVGALERLGGDVRFALRALRRNAGFTAGVVAILGIAIGACTTMFAVVDHVLLEELPHPHAERLVSIHNQNTPTNIWNIGTADFQGLKERQRSFDAFGAVSLTFMALSGGTTAPQQVRVGRVSEGFFRAVTARPAAGRLTTEQDDEYRAPAVVVLSDALATGQFGTPRAALGRTLTLDGVSHTVVGVLPPDVTELAGRRAAAWTALQMAPPTRRGPFWMQGVARLRDGVTIDDARRELKALSREIFREWNSDFRDTTASLVPFFLKERLVGRSRGQLGLFTAAVLLVLLVAVTNVATLMLVRATARSGELALREALGAGRGRLLGLVVTESFVLTLLAGAVGVLVAVLGVRLLPAIAPALPRLWNVRLDGRGLIGALGLAGLAGLLVSIAPVSMLRRRGAASLRVDERRVGTSRATGLLRGAFVTAEFALALPLLLGACLLLNSFVRLTRVDPGFDPRGMFAVSVALPAARYPDSTVLRFWRRLEQRVGEVAGVRGAGLTTVLPPNDAPGNSNFNLKDRPVPEGMSEPLGFRAAVSRGYFAMMGMRLLDGRGFTAGDSMTTDTTVRSALIVSRAWAEQYYPGESPLGKEVAIGGCWDCPDVIVGVVDNVKNVGIGATDEMMYNVMDQAGQRQAYAVVRGDGSLAIESRVLDAIRGLDPELPLTPIRLEERVSEALSDPRRSTAILSAFAGAAVLLAAVGVFALMSFVVRQRRREIGVRIALGARPAEVTGLIVRRGMRYALGGVAIGFALAVLGERWIRGMLFGVSASDPATIAAAAAGTLLAALLAAWLPGRRAARIHPVEALNSE